MPVDTLDGSHYEMGVRVVSLILPTEPIGATRASIKPLSDGK